MSMTTSAGRGERETCVHDSQHRLGGGHVCWFRGVPPAPTVGEKAAPSAGHMYVTVDTHREGGPVHDFWVSEILLGVSKGVFRGTLGGSAGVPLVLA
jgi:hypothetical protein